MMFRWYCKAAVYFFLMSDLDAAELNVRIADSRGAPIADAIVTIESQAEDARRPPAQTKTIDQKNETFIPYVEIFRPGDSVVFHNADHTRHHVYSFAPARQFEFVLTSGQSSEPLRLEQTGVVAVGCNIHDRMITYLYISDAPWIARSPADGHVTVHDLPLGDFSVKVWHPRLRPGQVATGQTLRITNLAEAKDLAFSLALLPDPRVPADRERADY